MQIKSWQIVLVGVIGQVFLTPPSSLFFFLLPGNFSYAFFPGCILIMLLYFNKTRKFGALLSLAISIFTLFLLWLLVGTFAFYIIMFFWPFLISLLIAGIYYFKVESKG